MGCPSRCSLLVGALLASGCTPELGDSSTLASSVTEDELLTIRDHLQDARATLPRLSEERRAALERDLTRAERAVDRYERLKNKGRTKARVSGVLVATTATLAGDDAAGIGIADDALIPFLLVGLLAVNLAAESAAKPRELTQSWNDVVGSLAAVGATASVELVRAIKKLPPPDQCMAHLALCLGTQLGRPHSGGKWGRSLCVDCFEICRGGRSWPQTTGDGKDCRWWNFVEGKQLGDN